MEISPILAALVNGGGLGILAAALFYLHTSALKVYREELTTERTECQKHHDRLVDSIEKLAKEIRASLGRRRESEGSS